MSAMSKLFESISRFVVATAEARTRSRLFDFNFYSHFE